MLRSPWLDEQIWLNMGENLREMGQLEGRTRSDRAASSEST